MSILSGDGWATVAIFVATQGIALTWTLATSSSNTRSLRTEMTVRLDGMQTELKALGNVLVTLADFKGEMRLMQERSLMQGGRIDDLTKELRAVQAARMDELIKRKDAD